MEGIIARLLNAVTVIFAVSSMLAVGLSFSLREVLGPLRHLGGVLRALVANFLIVPLAAIFIARLFQLEEPLAIGLFLTGAAAGAPFLIQLTTSAGGDLALSATLLVLLLPVTIVYMPIVVPFFAPGVSVSALSVGAPLVLTMLLPIFAGIGLRATHLPLAERLRPLMIRTSSVTLIGIILFAIAANIPHILDVTLRPILASALLVFIAFFAGYFLGGSRPGARSVMGLGTGQRNIAAAAVVATQAIEHRDTVLMVILASLVGLAVLFPIAARLRALAGAPHQGMPNGRDKKSVRSATPRART